MPLLTAFVFLAATLLFGVEPMIGRLLLPHFGGAVHVWLTCLVVFQGLLLAGYAWAHFVAPRIGAWHLALIVGAAIVLPLDVVAETAPDAPILEVMLAVLRAVGLPFMALSTVSVVAQLWFARSSHALPGQPYPLYAASNAGSLVALLAYPFVVEPLLGMYAQRWIWTSGYALLAIVAIACWWVVRPGLGRAPDAEPQDAAAPRPTIGDRALWLFLSATPSAFLLATTNVIASEVGSFPLVWVVPLALYLGSFMLVFRAGGGVPRWLGALWPEVLLAGLVIHQFGVTNLWLVGLCAAVLLGVSVLLHGELYERRPHPRYLTEFYLYMSLGGFIGGSLVSFVAPFVFPGVWEYVILLVVIVAGVGFVRGSGTVAAFRRHPLAVAAGRMTVLMVGATVLVMLSIAHFRAAGEVLASYRNFYGVFRVRDAEQDGVAIRQIVHGATLHGSQRIDPEPSLQPLAYYHASQCIAQTFAAVPSPRQIGIVGLGAGALAGFGEIGDQIDFYEIDPDNEKLARDWFSFLDASPARVSVRVGDGRLLLASADTTYDLLVIDAFSGDGIPAHLVNLEALRTYQQRLAPGGLVLLHVSNRYYDLRSVLKATAAVDGWAGTYRRGQVPVDEPLAQAATCIALARSPERLDTLVAAGWQRFAPDDGVRPAHPWTDDYVNVLAALMWRDDPAAR